MSHYLKYIAPILIFIGLLIYSLPNNQLEIVSSKGGCEELLCTYKVTVRNLSNNEIQFGYLKIKGEIYIVNTRYSTRSFIALNEKVNFDIQPNQDLILEGEYQVKMTDVNLIFTVHKS
jgi:hypothetical protein